MRYRREWKLDNAPHLIISGVALLCVAAGILHLSAAADHKNLPVMMIGFLVVALAQIGVAALLFLRGPSPRLLVGALVLTVGSIGMWLLSRTIGLPFLEGGHMEPIGFKDGVTVLFELAAVPGLLALGSSAVGGISLPTPHLGRQMLTGLSAGIVLMFVPALVLGGGEHHSHDEMAAMSEEGHLHEHGEEASGHDEHADHGRSDSDSHEHTMAEGPGQVLTGHDHQGEDMHGMGMPSEHAPGFTAHEGHTDGHADHGANGSHDEMAMAGMPQGSTADHSDGGHSGHSDHAEMDHGDMGDSHSGHAGHSDGGGDTGGDSGDHSGHSDHGDMDHGDMDHGDMGDGHSGHEGHGAGSEPGQPPVPGVATKREQYIEPKPAGTRETITLQYGPHPVPPGGDANQVNIDFFGADGFIVAAKPTMRYADGTEVGHSDGVHLHHAHLLRKDTEADDEADTRKGIDWVFGTGGEQTQGSFERISAAEPGSHAQWGIPMRREEMAMYWMPMNMTEQTQTVFMEFQFTFVHGTAAEIKKATGKTYRPVEPVIYGSTFNVPKTGGIYDWPLDAPAARGDALADSKGDPDSFMTAEPTTKANVKPGVGEIWTAPHDGVMIAAAGHMHGGGRGVVVSNLGSEAQPCAEDGDRIPGTTVLDSRAYYPHGVWPAHPLMGISQPGWRVPVKKGDRIALNGVYDARKYAFPDQMSILGFYWDKNVHVSPDQRCHATLADQPAATHAQAAESLPNQTAERGDDGSMWVHTERQPCVADGCNDYEAPREPRGPHTNVVTIEDFKFTPGDQKRKSTVRGSTGSSMGAAPVVAWGDKIRFVNLDYAEKGGTRHAITSCDGPCNGPTGLASYPNSNGLFYSGPLGYLPLSEGPSANNKAAPTWELDTSKLKPGYHTYFCWSHPWMRGAFYVEDMRGVSDGDNARESAPPAQPATPAPLQVPDLFRNTDKQGLVGRRRPGLGGAVAGQQDDGLDAWLP